MPLTARVERLEEEVLTLQKALAAVRQLPPEKERELARRLVIRSLREHGRVDGVKLAIEHRLNFGYIEEALLELERDGVVADVDD